MQREPDHSDRRSARRRLTRALRRHRALGRGACALALLSLGAGWLAPAPAAGAPALSWSASTIDGSGQPSAISCASESLCVAVDRSGNALTSSDPTSLEAHWATVNVDKGQSLSSISCVSPSMCVAADELGRVLASTNPAAGGWSPPQSIAGGTTLTGIACASPSLCVAIDAAGDVLASSNPASPAASWPVQYKDASPLRGVSCDASGCIAVDAAGNALAASNPTGGAGAWRPRAIDPAGGLSGVSCTPSHGCVAVDSGGNAFASADPTASAPTWSSTPVDSGGGLTAVSCADTSLCVAVGAHGEAQASDDPGAPLPTWMETRPGGALAGVSCLPGGFCLAVDASGHALTARVRAPAVVTATPAEVTATTATLSGSVEPNDAILLTCTFEYGTSTSYGQSAPCEPTPSPAGGAQAVNGQITGLAPNRTYHYRLLASSAVGSAVSPDVTFTTAVSTQVPLVYPHPSISGTPAVGQRLTCHSGVTSGATAQLSYQWLRDLRPIPGATGTSYVVRFADTAHHLQCQVTATDAGGSATARSSFVTVPVQGVPASTGETLVGRAHARGPRVSVPVTCSPLALSGCRLTLRVTAVETIRAGRIVAITARSPRRPSAHTGGVRRVTVTFGIVHARLAPRQHASVSLLLNAAARRLLASRHRMAVRVIVSGTVIGVIESALSEQTLELGATRRAGARHATAPRG
ncbi:MAG TPA: fibronectin type III domain-containing protein [Solirubrobacteraceae bacterium]|nr:fibronectin type III domain-containing protein [Solirubrobacteraceae bacterium]